MEFDAILFDGENPFEAGPDCHVIRLDGLSVQEIEIIENMASRNGIGVFFYLSKSSEA